MIKKSFVLSLVFAIVFSLSVFTLGVKKASAEAALYTCSQVSQMCGMVGGTTTVGDFPIPGFDGISVPIAVCANPNTSDTLYGSYLKIMNAWGAAFNQNGAAFIFCTGNN